MPVPNDSEGSTEVRGGEREPDLKAADDGRLRGGTDMWRITLKEVHNRYMETHFTLVETVDVEEAGSGHTHLHY